MAKSQKAASHNNRQVTLEPETPPVATLKANFGGPGVWLTGITLLLTTVTVMLYAAGKAYRAAYLAEFGGSDAMVAWSSQDLVYLGATCQLSQLLLILPVFFGFCVVSVFFLLGVEGIQQFVEKRKSKSSRVSATNVTPIGNSGLAEFLSLLSVVTAVAAAVVIMSTVYVGLAERKGTQDGRDLVKKIPTEAYASKGNRVLYYTEITRKVQSDSIIEKGFAITCSEKACLLYTSPKVQGGAWTLKFVPLDNVTNLTTTAEFI